MDENELHQIVSGHRLLTTGELYKIVKELYNDADKKHYKWADAWCETKNEWGKEEANNNKHFYCGYASALYTALRLIGRLDGDKVVMSSTLYDLLEIVQKKRMHLFKEDKPGDMYGWFSAYLDIENVIYKMAEENHIELVI